MTEVPQILAQLLEQVVVVASPSDLLALVHTMTVLAKVVADARIQLNYSGLEVSSQPQQGPAGEYSPGTLPLWMGCHHGLSAGRNSRVQVFAPLVHLLGCQSPRPGSVEKARCWGHTG